MKNNTLTNEVNSSDNQVNVAKSRLSVGHTKNDKVWSRFWQEHDVFHLANNSRTGERFVLLDGPPYANGDAHMGHALNKLFKDLVVKSQWFMNHKVDYRPGWDCHGLPLELAVEKRYGKLDTPTLKTRCKQLAFRSLVKQRKTFKNLGVLGEWEQPYLTLAMVQESWKSLKVLVQKNLLEYKQYPVHYCPACASSLAEAELEHKLLAKDSLYFKMKLEHAGKPRYALVWTTTPWTLPMNQALAYRPEFEYELWSNATYEVLLQNPEAVAQWLKEEGMSFQCHVPGSALEGLSAQSPLTQNKVRVLAADFVEEGKTGFVHVACAHGPEDFELGQSHGLKPVTFLNAHGVFDLVCLTPSQPELMLLEGKKYTQVQADVCVLLKDLLVSYSQDKTEQQVCWRHKCGVYYNSTWQSFLKLEAPEYNLKARVQQLLAQSELTAHYKDRLSQMLLSRPHWCLSRQRQWGCPMNLLVNRNTHTLDNALSATYLDYLAQGQDKEAQALLEANPHVEVFKDVLDVWFDSGNVVNDYVSREGKVNSGYAVHLALEGKDQFRGWFQSLFWLGVAVNDTVPYRDLFCHGFVLDEHRNKLSKSSGNGNLVEVYTEEFGADALHLWVAAQEPENDPVFSKTKLSEMQRYYSRLRLSLRFLTSNLYDYDYENHGEYWQQFKEKTEFDFSRHVLLEMKSLYAQCELYFKDYQFKKALEALYSFADKTLSNFYFDCVKNALYLRNMHSTERKMLQTGMYELLMGLFDLVKVFCPFVSEEFYQDYFNQGSVFEACYYAQGLEKLNDLQVVFDWHYVHEMRKKVQFKLEPLQKDKSVKSRTEVMAYLYTSQYEAMHDMAGVYRLADLMGVSHVELLEGNDEVDLQDLKLNHQYRKCPRCWNYESNFADRFCASCEEDFQVA